MTKPTLITRSKWFVPLAIFGGLLTIFLVLAVAPRLYWGDKVPAWIGNNYELTNVLFAALAFAGVIYTIVLQSEELRLQRQELEETRHELRRSAEAQENSQKVLFLTAYLNARNSVIDGFGRLNDQEDPKNIGPWEFSRAEMVAYMDALMWRLEATRDAPEVITIPPIEVARHRVFRIVRFLENRLARYKVHPERDRTNYINRTLVHVAAACRLTCMMLITTDGAENTLANRLAEIPSLVDKPLTNEETTPEAMPGATLRRAHEVLGELRAIREGR